MASQLQPLSPLPAPQAPIVDKNTGLVSKSWYEYLKRVDAHIREIEARLTAGGL